MSSIVAERLATLGLLKIARSVAEASLYYRPDDISPHLISLAFLDAIGAAELVIRASILKAELAAHRQLTGEEEVSELRLVECVNGSAALSFLELPQELARIAGKSLQNTHAYYEMNRLRYLLFSQEIDAPQLIEPTLRFAFESIEPLLIEDWEQIILFHVPELDFEVDRHIEMLLQQFNITPSNLDESEEDE